MQFLGTLFIASLLVSWIAPPISIATADDAPVGTEAVAAPVSAAPADNALVRPEPVAAPIPVATADDAPFRPEAQPDRHSTDAKILSGLEQLCKEQGWGHWWNGSRCLSNEEASRLTKEEALELIRRQFGPHNPIF